MSDSPSVDPSTPHPARRYNYWLGGKDHFAADRASGDAIEEIFPTIRTAALENRAFLRRAVTHLVTVHGIRQFLDVGTGLPAPGNTHEVAQALDPTARVVYVDNDPLVLVHARALLTSGPHGATAYIDADLRRPEQILDHPALRGTLDLSRPVALLLVAVLHFVDDDARAAHAVRTLMDALPAGSFLVLTHATADLLPPDTAAALASAATGFTSRSRDQIAGLCAGLTVEPPGVTVVGQWRPESGTSVPPPEQVSVYGVVAYKSGSSG